MFNSQTERKILDLQDFQNSQLLRAQHKRSNNNSKINQFHQAFKRIKVQNHVNHFISKLKRYNLHSKASVFKPRQLETHLIQAKGIQIHPLLENIVLVLDLIFTLANFILSTFQAFLPGYQDFKDENPQIVIINLIAAIIYIFKTVVSLINQDVEHGVHYVYITDIIKKQIIKGRFIVQIALAIIIIINISTTKAIEAVGIIYFILCVFKIYNLSFSLVKIELMFINNIKKQRYWNLLKVFIFNLLFAHFMASIFLAMLKIGSEKNWSSTKYNAPLNPLWFQLYISAYYWACTTMITIGFGDFVPITAGQAAIVSAVQILSSIVVAYNVSQIGSIILSINQKSKVINSKISLLRRINKKDKIPLLVSIQLEEYIVESQKIQEDFQYQKHKQLIGSMPQQLQEKYYKAAIVNIYRKLTFFMNLRSQTLIVLFKEQTGKVYYPGQYLIKKSFSQQIYIVLKGQLGFCYQKIEAGLNGTVIQQIDINYQNNKPIVLAKNIFNRNQGIHFDIKATKYSYSFHFSIEKFIEILKINEMDYHFYLMTLDLHQTQNSLAFNKCTYCIDSFHTKFECPKLHFMPFSNIVIQKHNSKAYSQAKIQKRLPFHRKRPSLKINHVYKLKNELKVEVGQQEVSIKNIDSKNFLQMAMVFFGDKSIDIKNIPNKILKKFLAQKQILVHITNEDKDQLQFFETLMDFRHYFRSFNPQKLQRITLSKSKQPKYSKPYSHLI